MALDKFGKREVSAHHTHSDPFKKAIARGGKGHFKEAGSADATAKGLHEVLGMKTNRYNVGPVKGETKKSATAGFKDSFEGGTSEHAHVSLNKEGFTRSMPDGQHDLRDGNHTRKHIKEARNAFTGLHTGSDIRPEGAGGSGKRGLFSGEKIDPESAEGEEKSESYDGFAKGR